MRLVRRYQVTYQPDVWTRLLQADFHTIAECREFVCKQLEYVIFDRVQRRNVQSNMVQFNEN